ncbi:MAG TPA: tyrosine-type recombinase/integrase, partial [Candidatus Eremiobacteraceae bacterium]|nr:tyrosine-type recombinase/integrase [Candidatus Eremiobacteraceae bacterium]
VKHREQQAAESVSPWVFTNTEGNPLHRNNFRNRDWAALLDTAKLGPLRFYDLRHTSSTLGLAAGVPVKVIQERLGHASAKMTLDVYAKVVPSLQAKAADQMTDIFRDWCTSWCTSAGGELEKPEK